MKEAEQLKITAINLRSILSESQSDLRNTVKKRKFVKKSIIRKRKQKIKEAKIEKKSSPLDGSVQNIKRSSKSTGLFKNLGGNILKFVSLLLLGVVISNLDVLKEKVNEAFKKFNEGLTVISNVVDSIYEGLFGFSEDFDKNVPDLDKDVSKLKGEMDEAKPLIEKIKELAEKAKKAADNMEGESLLRPFDKGTLETGEGYEVFNIFDENKQVVPYIRITDEQGAVKTLSLEEYQNSLKKNIIKDNPKLKNLIDTDKYMGEKKTHKSVSSIKESVRLAEYGMGSLGLSFIFFPEFYLSLFTNDMSIIKMGIAGLRVVGALQFLDAIGFVLMFALIGAGNTVFPAVVESVLTWLVVVLGTYVFGVVLNFGVVAPWFLFPVYMSLFAGIMVWKVQQGDWKNIDL